MKIHIKKSYQMSYVSNDLFGAHMRTVFALANSEEHAMHMLRTSLDQMGLEIFVIDTVAIIVED